ncbi:MAG: hypothetical protein ABIA04_14335 [Pseudomonadota bacterium]
MKALIKILLILLIIGLSITLFSCADDVDTGDDSDANASTCAEGDEDCTDGAVCDEDGNCGGDDDGDDNGTAEDETVTATCSSGNIQGSSITSRYYSLIPDFNNDHCFNDYYNDREFLACSAYEIPFVMADDKYYTGPDMLAKMLGVSSDKSRATMMEEANDDYAGPYIFLNDYEEYGNDTVFVSGYSCTWDIQGVDFLLGQLYDFWDYLSYYYDDCYDCYSYDPYGYDDPYQGYW